MMNLFGAAKCGALLTVVSISMLACGDKSSEGDDPGSGGMGGSINNGGNGGDGGSVANGGSQPTSGDGGANAQGGNGGNTANGGNGGGPQAQGGSAGAPMGAGGSPETGGSAGMAGSAGSPAAGGAAGATALDCGDACDPCSEGWEIAACSEGPLAQCVCEPENSSAEAAYNALLACSLAEPCPEAVLTGIPTPSWEGAACLRSGLSARTPGRYRFTSDSSDLGTNTSHFELLVSADGSVLMTGVSTAGSLVGNLRRQYFPLQRCTLKSAEAVEACIPENDGLGNSPCAAPSDWVQDCENIDAGCPAD